ncbi:MAG: glutamate-5-semialdehyde dehydrogenase [Clostridiales bacterium]|nr:glutamate-5-semialdehyde dehydrogenase [Clostridiales bacterium]
MTTHELFKRAKAAAPRLATLGTEKKNAALLAMADALTENADEILRVNREDVAAQEGIMSPVMIDRLRLTKERIEGMAQGVRDVAALPDPIGVTLESAVRPNGLRIERRTVPLGVIGIIYESRPNVTSDAAALCLKSGNVCVLKSGKEAFHTAFTIVRILKDALQKQGLDPDFICMPEDASRAVAQEMMAAVGSLDVLIPRGGAGLIRTCLENAKVPCIETGTGICHIYIDKSADLEMALAITENAKASRPSVCNAAEVLLVHEGIAAKFLPMLQSRLTTEREKKGLPVVELRVDEKAAKFIDGTRANEDDFDTEFSNYILAVGVVASVDEAIAHIGQHSTHHSETIVTSDESSAEKFLGEVDSAAVYVNASTRFTDGGEFGKGCEIGISTQKLHARGPMGLRELTSYKYVIRGNGQVR